MFRLMSRKIGMTEADKYQLRLLREQVSALESMRATILQQIAEWTECQKMVTDQISELEDKYGLYDAKEVNR